MVTYRKVRIGSIGKIVTGKTPPTSNSANYGSEYMFLGPADLHKHFIIQDSEKMITQQGLQSIKGSIINGLSILVGCIGWDMGNVGLVNAKCATNQQINSITEINSDFNSYYIYYWLFHKKQFLFKQANITRTPILNKTGFSNIEIPLPNKTYQDKIAKFLTSLDSKIELNNRINTELEAMAKTLYDYWFVQFDFPNEQGKPYKSSGGKMVYNNELKREIPEGWSNGELQEIANITMGQSPPGESYNEEGVGTVFYQGCTDFGLRFPTNRKFTTQPSRYAKEGDILLSVRAPVGTMNIANENCCIGRGLASLNSKDDCIGYLDGVLNYMKQIFDRRNSDGTTFGSITKGDLFSLAVVKPDKKILKRFDSIVKPMFKKQNEIGVENQQLASLRDWLLPMLMNGQVTVKEAEEKFDNLDMAAEPVINYKKTE